LGFEKKDGTMAKVKVDEMLRFLTILVFSRRFEVNVLTVGNEAAKVTTDYAMPCGTLSFIKLRDALVELNTSYEGSWLTSRLMYWAISFSMLYWLIASCAV
jgi:hypothetical protein